MSKFRVWPGEKLLARKELAAALGVSYSYVQQMCNRGFPMPGGRATLREAREWLAATKFSYGSVYIRKSTET
ncbi:MAG: hypothetical protein PHT43_02275 [Anaerolineaceae bacterium]|jgi:hypothetical protein|nr:hypothetical protein [Anaerolineaceae bacterium]